MSTEHLVTEEQSTYRCLIAICGMVTVALIISCSMYYYNLNKTAMENGYEQGMINGYNRPVWIKKDD